MNKIERFEVEVEGGLWPLARIEGSEEPRILDVELAKRFGYARPRAIRDLVERLVKDGILNDSELCRVVRQSGGRPATEYWLTEKQAIMVTIHSKTDTAIAMANTVVHVFWLAAHGKLPVQVAGSAELAKITATLGQLVEDNQATNERLDSLAKQLGSVASSANETRRDITVLNQRGNATMAPSEQNRLNALRRRLAQLFADRQGKTPKQAWRIVGNMVEQASGFCGPLKDLPLHKYADVIRALEQMVRRLEDEQGRTPPLPFGPKAA